MFSSERETRIVVELEQRGRVEVAALAALLAVSEDTVRRDLRRLHERGVLHKTHGGAVALDPARMAWQPRVDLRAGGKAAIGRAAAALVSPGDAVVLDAGSTVLQLARAVEARPLNVLTNSLDIAAVFDTDPRVELALTGGEWDPRSRYLSGSGTLAALAGRRADWAFLGTCALHPVAGATSVSDADADVKRTMSAAATRTVVLADGSKLGEVAAHLVARLDALHCVVTDDPDAADGLRAAGVSVVLAAKDPQQGPS